MSEPDTSSDNPAYDVGHTHPVSGCWLRAASTYLLGLLVAAVM